MTRKTDNKLVLGLFHNTRQYKMVNASQKKDCKPMKSFCQQVTIRLQNGTSLQVYVNSCALLRSELGKSDWYLSKKSGNIRVLRRQNQLIQFYANTVGLKPIQTSCASVE